jgi:hypothetical protein
VIQLAYLLYEAHTTETSSRMLTGEGIVTVKENRYSHSGSSPIDEGVL